MVLVRVFPAYTHSVRVRPIVVFPGYRGWCWAFCILLGKSLYLTKSQHRLFLTRRGARGRTNGVLLPA